MKKIIDKILYSFGYMRIPIITPKEIFNASMQSKFSVKTIKEIFPKNSPDEEIQREVFKALIRDDAFHAHYNGKEIEVEFRYLKDHRMQAIIEKKIFGMKVEMDPSMPKNTFDIRYP